LLRHSASPSVVKDWRWLLLAIAFPAVFVNLGHGHNGFLTAALLAGGIALLDTRPIVAGVLFGLLAYKPQFAVAIPLVLLVTGRWRTIAAGAFTVATLTAIVTALFGTEVWSAFLTSTHFTRTVVLEQGSTGFNKIQSVFSWVRMWGGSIPLAYVMQGVASAAAAAGLVIIWRNQSSFADKGAALCLTALLTTPYCLDYDLMVFAPAIALLGAQGLACGFRPYEKSLLVLLWLVPILARGVAAATLIPLGPISLLLAGLFLVSQTRGLFIRGNTGDPLEMPAQHVTGTANGLYPQ
jgi:alpha-1,2-mannosyltransferase